MHGRIRMQQNCWDRLYTGIRAGIRLYWLESVSGTFMSTGILPLFQRYGKKFAVMSWSGTSGLKLDWPRIETDDVIQDQGSLRPEAVPAVVERIRSGAGSSFVPVFKALQDAFKPASAEPPPPNASSLERRQWVERLNRQAEEEEEDDSSDNKSRLKAVILVVHDADELFNSSQGRMIQRFILESLDLKTPVKLIMTAPVKCPLDSYRDHCMELVEPLPDQWEIARGIAPVLRGVHAILGGDTPIVFSKEGGEIVQEPVDGKRPEYTEISREIAGRLTGLTRSKALDVARIELGERASEFVAGGKNEDSLVISATDLTSEKAKILNAYGFMELINDRVNENQIGGLKRLKSWLHLRRNGFKSVAEDLCLDMPKGVVLVGPPGTAKSMCAKMAGSILGFPIIRLDMGAMFKSLLGESEANMARALSTADAASPCVLWLDEMAG